MKRLESDFPETPESLAQMDPSLRSPLTAVIHSLRAQDADDRAQLRVALELIDVIEAVVGHRVERDMLATRPGDVRDPQADNRRLRGLVPDPEPVALRIGIEHTVEWFRSTARG